MVVLVFELKINFLNFGTKVHYDFFIKSEEEKTQLLNPKLPMKSWMNCASCNVSAFLWENKQFKFEIKGSAFNDYDHF